MILEREVFRLHARLCAVDGCVVDGCVERYGAE